MKKIIKLTESDLARIVRRAIVESEIETKTPTEDVTTLNIKELSNEVGTEVDAEVANEVMSCSFDEIGSNLKLKPEAKELLDKVREKVKDLVSKKDKGGLKLALGKLKSQLSKTESQQGDVNEQVALMGTFALMGITAPLWAWALVGGIVLILLIKGIVALTSWIPRKKGRGCSRTITYRVR